MRQDAEARIQSLEAQLRRLAEQNIMLAELALKKQ